MQKNTAHFQLDFQTHYTLPYQVFRCSVFYKIVINLYKYSNENVVLREQKKGFRTSMYHITNVKFPMSHIGPRY